MQGLKTLYGYPGRAVEWRRLVDELVPDLVDPDTGEPLPGRAEGWFAIDYRVDLAIRSRDWASAERLQRARVHWNRAWAAAALSIPEEALDEDQRNRIRNLAVSVQKLGYLLWEQQRARCVQYYEEAISLRRRIGARREEAVVASYLGYAYKDIADLRDLDQAERWYRTSFELRDLNDRFGRAECATALGALALHRFLEARDAGVTEKQCFTA